MVAVNIGFTHQVSRKNMWLPLHICGLNCCFQAYRSYADPKLARTFYLLCLIFSPHVFGVRSRKHDGMCVKNWNYMCRRSSTREAKSGDIEAAKRRMALLAGIPPLELTDAVYDLANRLVDGAALPAKAMENAFHIAIVTIDSYIIYS